MVDGRKGSSYKCNGCRLSQALGSNTSNKDCLAMNMVREGLGDFDALSVGTKVGISGRCHGVSGWSC